MRKAAGTSPVRTVWSVSQPVQGVRQAGLAASSCPIQPGGAQIHIHGQKQAEGGPITGALQFAPPAPVQVGGVQQPAKGRWRVGIADDHRARMMSPLANCTPATRPRSTKSAHCLARRRLTIGPPGASPNAQQESPPPPIG